MNQISDAPAPQKPHGPHEVEPSQLAQVFLADSKLIWSHLKDFALKPERLRQVVTGPQNISIWVAFIWAMGAQIIALTIKFGLGFMGIAGGNAILALAPKAFLVALILALAGRENFRRSFVAMLLALIPVLLIMGSLPTGIVPLPVVSVIRCSLIALYALAALPRLRLPGNPFAAFAVLTLAILVVWRMTPGLGPWG